MAVIDGRTTVICLHVSGEIVAIDEPFDTLNGSYDDPPFHTHCRTIEVPWMAGFINEARTAANAELQNRPLSQRDTRNFRGIPGPDNGPSAPLRPGGPDVGVQPVRGGAFHDGDVLPFGVVPVRRDAQFDGAGRPRPGVVAEPLGQAPGSVLGVRWPCFEGT